MSEMSDVYRELKRMERSERADMRKLAPQRLRDAGLKFKSHNGGAHLVILSRGHYYDFWPGTERWKMRSVNKAGYGIDSLIEAAS